MKNKILILALALGLVQMSCSDYLDVNDSKNNPTGEIVPANLVLAGALETIYPTQGVTMNRLGNAFMNTWGPNVNSFTGGFADEFSLAIDNTFYSGIWSGLYLGIYPFQAIIDSEGTEFNNHKAIAMIMKTFYMQYIVDLYGDVPYTEAFQRGDNLTPKYDDDLTIYRDFIVQLNAAIALIDSNTGSQVGNEDIIFNGAMSSWRSFANTLKVRILLREATLAETNSDSDAYLTTQFDLIDGATFFTDNVTINPGYSNGATNQQNPFFGTYGEDINGSVTTNNNFVRASEYAVQFLQGATTGVADNRLTTIYRTNSAGNYVGIRQGETDSDDPLSGLGSGLLVDSSQDGYIMTSAEAFFLLAEAYERGYLTGDPATAYNNGIQASFDLLGSTNAPAYYGNPSISYAASTNKIESIMTQKWIAVNGINAIESWIDYTRTGFPIVPLPTSAQFSDKPNRLMYPNSEFSGNAANVPAQTQADAFNTNVFWGN